MKKVFLAVVAVIIAISCGAQSTPVKTTEAFLNAMKNKDYNLAVSYTDAEDDDVEDYIVEVKNAGITIKSFEIRDVEIDGDEAAVKVLMTIVDDRDNEISDSDWLDLVFEDGKWVVVL